MIPAINDPDFQPHVGDHGGGYANHAANGPEWLDEQFQKERA